MDRRIDGWMAGVVTGDVRADPYQGYRPPLLQPPLQEGSDPAQPPRRYDRCAPPPLLLLPLPSIHPHPRLKRLSQWTELRRVCTVAAERSASLIRSVDSEHAGDVCLRFAFIVPHHVSCT